MTEKETEQFKEAFSNWLEHPITKALRRKIREDIENYKLMLISVEPNELHKLQAHCEAAIKLSELTYEDLI